MKDENIDAVRENAKNLAADYIAKGDATGWFDRLYAEAAGDNEKIPWADLEPNRFLVRWAKENNLKGDGKNALVVGCGLGDDAKFLEESGFAVTAFDISENVVRWAKQIHSETDVEFYQVDLFDAPADWKGKFDFVLEVYTIQALPLDLRGKTIDSISDLVAEGGELLVVTRHRENGEEIGELPWGLSAKDLSRFEENGLKQTNLTEMFDADEEEPIKRVAVQYKREKN